MKSNVVYLTLDWTQRLLIWGKAKQKPTIQAEADDANVVRCQTTALAFMVPSR